MRLFYRIEVITILAAVPYILAQTACLKCSSETSGCNPGTLQPSPCPQDDDSCYSLTVAGGFELERGCLSSLSETEQTQCRNSTDHTCQICTGSAGCNREEWHKCHQCTKSSNNMCAFTPNRIMFCRNYHADDRCYAQVNGTEVSRGCVSDLEEGHDPCEGNRYCMTCAGDACNSGSQNELKNVTRCVQCKEGEFRCVDGTTDNSECDDREDTCYIKMWDEGKLDRGCIKKLGQDEQDRCNDESDRSCFSCSGHACNYHRWLKCFQCSPERNATCAEEQTNSTLSFYCENFQVNDRCYAKLVDFKVTRGCVSDLGLNVDPCEGNNNCEACSSDACNTISEAYLKNKSNPTYSKQSK